MLATLLACGVSGEPSPPPRPSRERLIYKHVAKTGGQAIISKLKAEYTPLLADGTLVIKREQEPVTLADARESYVISSVRNPCSMYVSLWAWGIMGHGRYNRLFKEAHQDDTAMAHVLDSVSNASAFGAFARASLGEFSRRYRDFLPVERVDCWVHTETLDSDLEECLSRFEAQASPATAARMRAAGARGGRGGVARSLSSGGDPQGGSDGSDGGGDGVHGGGIQSGSDAFDAALGHSPGSPRWATLGRSLPGGPVLTSPAPEPDVATAQYRGGEASSTRSRRRVSSADEYNAHQSQHAECGWYYAGDAELAGLIKKVRCSRGEASIDRGSCEYREELRRAQSLTMGDQCDSLP
jgi:hypothetical protein